MNRQYPSKPVLLRVAFVVAALVVNVAIALLIDRLAQLHEVDQVVTVQARPVVVASR